MGRPWLVVGAGIAAVVALVLVYAAGVPLPVVLSVGAGALCLVWLVVLLTVPWNLYFRARTVLHEIRVSREKGLAVSPERDAEAARIARVTLSAAVGGQLGSAALIAGVAWFSGREVGYWFAVFYVVSTFLRPAGAYFGHLRQRLRSLLSEVRHPRDDVLAVRERLAEVERGMRVLEAKAEEQYAAQAEMRREMEGLKASQFEHQAAVDAKFGAISRKFEETVDRLTDNQEVITGIKAFLRLLRSDPV